MREAWPLQIWAPLLCKQSTVTNGKMNNYGTREWGGKRHAPASPSPRSHTSQTAQAGPYVSIPSPSAGPTGHPPVWIHRSNSSCTSCFCVPFLCTTHRRSHLCTRPSICSLGAVFMTALALDAMMCTSTSQTTAREYQEKSHRESCRPARCLVASIAYRLSPRGYFYFPLLIISIHSKPCKRKSRANALVSSCTVPFRLDSCGQTITLA